MKEKNIAYQTIDWSKVKPTEHAGDPGTAFWRTMQYDGLRVRMVEYSPGYVADHWCKKGHIVHCLEGDFHSEFPDGTKSELSAGMTYVVSDDLSEHKSVTEKGLKLLIIDGDLLKLK